MTRFRRATALVSLAMAFALATAGCAADAPADTDTSAASDDLVISELHDMLPADVIDAGKIVVGTDPSYPPCDFLDDDGEIDGYNNAILQALAPLLGVDITMESIAFDGLLPGVESGRFDAAMECITDNLEREEIVQFVDYSYGAKGVITLADSDLGIEENPLTLCGLHAGVQTGTEFVDDVALVNENCENEGEESVEITNFPTAADQNTALQSGQIDFAVTNIATGAWQAKEADGLFEVIPSPLTSKTYLGIVTALEDDGLSEALLGALQAIIDDGTYEDVMSEWGLEDIMLTEPGINLASTDPLETPTACGSCGF